MPIALRKAYENERQRFKVAQEILADHLRQLLRAKALLDPAEIETRVSARVKDAKSVFRKVRVIERREGVKIRSLRSLLAYVDDLAGVRVVCDYLTDVPFIIGYVHSHPAFQVLPEKIQDYINKPKDGYRGVHLIVWVGTSFGKTKCELQIQTALQHAWAARSHALLYKLDARDIERIPEELKFLMVNQSDLLYVIDQMVRITDSAIARHLRRGR